MKMNDTFAVTPTLDLVRVLRRTYAETRGAAPTQLVCTPEVWSLIVDDVERSGSVVPLYPMGAANPPSLFGMAVVVDEGEWDGAAATGIVLYNEGVEA